MDRVQDQARSLAPRDSSLVAMVVIVALVGAIVLALLSNVFGALLMFVAIVLWSVVLSGLTAWVMHEDGSRRVEAAQETAKLRTMDLEDRLQSAEQVASDLEHQRDAARAAAEEATRKAAQERREAALTHEAARQLARNAGYIPPPAACPDAFPPPPPPAPPSPPPPPGPGVY
jgi:hypothetical protein